MSGITSYVRLRTRSCFLPTAVHLLFAAAVVVVVFLSVYRDRHDDDLCMPQLELLQLRGTPGTRTLTYPYDTLLTHIHVSPPRPKSSELLFSPRQQAVCNREGGHRGANKTNSERCLRFAVKTATNRVLGTKPLGNSAG